MEDTSIKHNITKTDLAKKNYLRICPPDLHINKSSLFDKLLKFFHQNGMMEKRSCFSLIFHFDLTETIRFRVEGWTLRYVNFHFKWIFKTFTISLRTVKFFHCYCWCSNKNNKVQKLRWLVEVFGTSKDLFWKTFFILITFACNTPIYIANLGKRLNSGIKLK